jgi:hypothetical protein
LFDTIAETDGAKLERNRLFFNLFFIRFAKSILPFQNLAKLTYHRRSSWSKPPWTTAVAGATVYYRRNPWQLGSVCFQKIAIFLFKLEWRFYTKLVAFDEIYKFVVQKFIS